MDWKSQLRSLEEGEQWDVAIELLQNIIRAYPEDMDPYICMNFLLMDLLVEEDYDQSKRNDYQVLLKWYFYESYAKFSHNAEYLYFTAKTAEICEFFLGIDQRLYENMIEQAKTLDPNNPIYKENYYWSLREKNPVDPELIFYAKMVVEHNSPVKKYLETKGRIGRYLLGMKENWCKRVLRNAERLQKDAH